MKSGDGLRRTPVTTPQRVPTIDIQRGGDALSMALGDHQQNVLGHRLGEVLEELAGHLEEDYQSLLSQGISDEGAIQRSLKRVDDWRVLKQRIESARKKENPMPKRVAQFWLPAFLTLLLSMVLLAVIQVFGPNPWTRAASRSCCG